MPTSRVTEFPTSGPVLAGGERPVQQAARTFTLLVSAFTIGLDMPGGEGCSPSKKAWTPGARYGDFGAIITQRGLASTA